jgi:disulfide bond formation protein DsbB
MSPVEPRVPPAGEHIHLPGPSLQPFMVAVAVTLALLGLTTTVWLIIAGLVLLVVTLFLWIRDMNRDLEELPATLDDH